MISMSAIRPLKAIVCSVSPMFNTMFSASPGTRFKPPLAVGTLAESYQASKVPSAPVGSEASWEMKSAELVLVVSRAAALILHLQLVTLKVVEFQVMTPPCPD